MKIFAKLEILLPEICFVGIYELKIFTYLVLMTGTFYSDDNQSFVDYNRFHKKSFDGQCHSINHISQHRFNVQYCRKNNDFVNKITRNKKN